MEPHEKNVKISLFIKLTLIDPKDDTDIDNKKIKTIKLPYIKVDSKTVDK
tara:strand:+ start:104 stop:253 length:150 start_codon:yes stop_codon:yes gene_type:complete